MIEIFFDNAKGSVGMSVESSILTELQSERFAFEWGRAITGFMLTWRKNTAQDLHDGHVFCNLICVIHRCHFQAINISVLRCNVPHVVRIPAIVTCGSWTHPT